jgi:deoxyribonuclease IV
MVKTVKRIGIHLGTAGGASNAVEKAREIGANTFQFFSSSPRMWRAPKVDPKQAERMRELRAKLDVGPLVIHTSYLVNVCSQTTRCARRVLTAFRGEIERALTFGAEYLVLHPGSWNGLTRDEGLKLAADSITRAIDGLAWQGTGFHILIENTAGAEFSLGGSFEQVAELVDRLKLTAPVAVCLDTCHTHVAGYDLVQRQMGTRRRWRRSPRRSRLTRFACGIATMPRLHADPSLTAMSTSGRATWVWNRSADCSTTSALPTRLRRGNAGG